MDQLHPPKRSTHAASSTPEPASELGSFRKGVDDSYLAKYFQQLATRFFTLPQNVGNPQAWRIAREILALPATEVRWADIYSLEHAYLVLLPDDGLREEAISLAEECRAVGGADRYARLRAELLLKEPPAEPAALRAQMLRIQNEMHSLYAARPELEVAQSRATQVCAFWLLGLLGCFGAASVWFWSKDQTPQPYVAFAAFFGALGSVFSKLQRITAIPADADPVAMTYVANRTSAQVVAAMIIGATSAALLYCVFAGGLLQGALFPAASDAASPAPSQTGPTSAVIHFFTAGLAAGLPSIGKMVVWSFIAGFSERFFADTIDRLVGKGDAAQQETAAAT